MFHSTIIVGLQPQNTEANKLSRHLNLTRKPQEINFRNSSKGLMEATQIRLLLLRNAASINAGAQAMPSLKVG